MEEVADRGVQGLRSIPQGREVAVAHSRSLFKEGFFSKGVIHESSEQVDGQSHTLTGTKGVTIVPCVAPAVADEVSLGMVPVRQSHLPTLCNQPPVQRAEVLARQERDR